jgi:hypothetical protein
MIRNNNIDYNQVIGLKEARQIVEILKRHYPGVFDGLEIKYGDYYCYDDARHIVYIQWKIDETEEDTIRENAVIDIVNEKYGLNLGYSAREKSMQAFLHELGHAADLSYKKVFGQYKRYTEEETIERMIFDSNKYAYFNMRMEYEDLIEAINFKLDLSDEERNEKLKDAEELEKEIEEVEHELDYEYREIITEKAADKFSADLLKGLFRNII